MRKTLGIPLALLIGCATGVSVRDLVVPARAAGQTGPNYEYDVLRDGDGADAQKYLLAKYGREGWRLVSATQNGSYTYLYVERQLPHQ